MPLGRQISTKPQPATEERPVSQGPQPHHCPVTQPSSSAHSQGPAVSQQGPRGAWRRAVQLPAEPEQMPGQVSAKLSSSMGQFGVFHFSVFKQKAL